MGAARKALIALIDAQDEHDRALDLWTNDDDHDAEARVRLAVRTLDFAWENARKVATDDLRPHSRGSLL